MKAKWAKFKEFWGREEVPRWLGISLVTVYAIGLFGVAYTAVAQTQQETERHVRHATSYAVELIADGLATAEHPSPGEYQRAIRDFAAHFPCEQLRVINASETVIASIRSEETGKPRPTDLKMGRLRPARIEIYDLPPAESGDQRCLFRAPVKTAETTALVLEGVARTPRSPIGVIASRSWTLTIVLATMGVLFLLYRQLRGHLRGVSRIAANLASHSDVLEHELGALRISDTVGTVVSSWNRLIDLTESFRAEAQRSAASSELKAVLERSAGGELANVLQAIPDGVMVISEGRAVEYANRTMECLFGDPSREGVAGRSLPELAPSPLGSEILRIVGDARTPDGAFAVHSAVVHAGTEDSSYRVRVAPVQSRHQHGVCIVVVSDISQQIRADKAREEFVSQVTHELRTPLTNIRAYAETLSSGMFDDPKVITECYNVITKETRRLSRLIEDILSVSQLEVGTLQLVTDDVDLHRLLTESVRDMRGLAEEKSIDMQLSLPAKLPVIQGDRDKLAVVLNNLLGNALKYTASGGEVRVGCQVSDTEVSITVKDSGIGIDPSEHDRIFERFQRGSDPAVRAETGTGIGLTTAREIARRHGGDIHVISEKGKGATFVARIPCAASVAT